MMEWNESYSVGLPLIDRHHKMLMGYINTMALLLEEGKAKTEVGLLLQELKAYTKMHFSYEEALFHQYGYPQEEEHTSYHHNLVHKVDDFIARFQTGTADLNVELLEFLQHWLNHHILKEDMAYSAFLREKMLRKAQ